MSEQLAMGTWWFESELDSRWNFTGRGLVGSRALPPMLRETFEKLVEKYGNPPKDLTWDYVLD